MAGIVQLEDDGVKGAVIKIIDSFLKGVCYCKEGLLNLISRKTFSKGNQPLLSS